MTAILSKNDIDADQTGYSSAGLVGHGTAAAVRGRGAAQARGVSPRLTRSRIAPSVGVSTTVSNGAKTDAVRTAETLTGPIRVVGARGSGTTRSVERARVRPNRRVRGVSRVGGCARRTVRPTMLACAVAAAGSFVAVVLLFGGGSSDVDTATASSATPALTSVVTVRTGQSLEQVAREIAPDRPVAQVVAQVEELNGLSDGVVRPGQTLVTPRY